MIDFTDVLLLCLYNHDCLFPDRCDEMAQLMKLVIPVWSSIGQDFCVPSMHNREFKFGYQHFLLCQKSFLKVSSKWLLKNKSDNGKLLLGKTYSDECFRAIQVSVSGPFWPSCFQYFPFYDFKKTVCVFDYISIYLSFENTSNLDLPEILSFGKGWKVVGKEEIICHVQFYPFPKVYQACHVKSWLLLES